MGGSGLRLQVAPFYFVRLDYFTNFAIELQNTQFVGWHLGYCYIDKTTKFIQVHWQ